MLTQKPLVKCRFFLQVEVALDYPDDELALQTVIRKIEALGLKLYGTDDTTAKLFLKTDQALEDLYQASAIADEFFIQTGWPVSVSIVCDSA